MIDTSRRAATQHYFTFLTAAMRQPEAEILTHVFEIGLRQAWREVLLGQYLRREITREDAIDAVGIDWVELAERQWHAAQEDMAWGLSD